MAQNYSLRLCEYIGRIELNAHSIGKGLCHIIFTEAIEKIPKNLSRKESNLARDILNARARETTPVNTNENYGQPE